MLRGPGRPPVDNPSTQFSIFMPASTLDKLRAEVYRADVKFAEYIRGLIADGLKYRAGEKHETIDMRELQRTAGKWHKDMFGYLGNWKRFHAQVHKATEEIGELNNTAVQFICRKDDSRIGKLDEALADDCADVLFCLMTLCHMRGIDLLSETAKVVKNVTENRTYTEGVKDR